MAAIQASAELIGCPLRALSFRTTAQAEHKRLPEWEDGEVGQIRFQHVALALPHFACSGMPFGGKAAFTGRGAAGNCAA